ncbi:uncharacterized protein LOC101451072 [Anopheles sinensis]|uniref:Uncharacterized protein LOC101451072 n=1 Tax=Anopheles sinensis TaxID=74873 RepID=A0A084VQE0_ANOSI|nr:uncharacterized protein LOC101451072 [Anopheles sinensis]
MNITVQQAQDCPIPITIGVHTRSGRLSKPPSALPHGNEHPITRDRHEQQFANVGATETFHGERSTEENKENPEVEKMPIPAAARRKQPTIQPQHRCGTCHKIFLGRRMARHLRTHPTHVTMDKDETTPSVKLSSSPLCRDTVPKSPRLPAPQLFRLLVQLVTAAETESQQRDVLLTEISQFVGLIRSLVPSLIVPSEQEDNDTVYVDQNVADVLQLNCGKYRFRMDAFGSETVQCAKNSITEDVSAVSGVAVPSYQPLSEETVDQEKDPEWANVSFAIEPRIKPVKTTLAEIYDLQDLQQQGRLPAMPLPTTDHLATNGIGHIEPVTSSNHGTTAFGRPCRLTEELFPSQSQLLALEELTNLSELCSPQVLGVPSGALPNESSVLNFD